MMSAYSNAHRSSAQPSRRRFLKLAAAAGAAAAGAPLLSACGDSPSASGSASDTVKLIHAAKDPLVLWSVTYLAEDEGFYKEEGLSLGRAHQQHALHAGHQ